MLVGFSIFFGRGWCFLRGFSRVMNQPASRIKHFLKPRGSRRVGSEGARNLTDRVGSGQQMFKPRGSDRVGSGRVRSGRVGSGRVGSDRVGYSRVGSRGGSNLTGRIGSGRIKTFSNSLVGSDHRNLTRPGVTRRTKCDLNCFCLFTLYYYDAAANYL